MASRKLKLISKELHQLLIKQAIHELQNYFLYDSFANYFALENLESLSKYYKKRAEEEKVHYEWIYTYLTDADCRIVFPTIPMVEGQEATSLIDPFVTTVDKEIETTQMIYKIYEQAKLDNDYMSCTWLQEKLIPEQTEEENTSRLARGIMELEGDILLKSHNVLKLLK